MFHQLINLPFVWRFKLKAMQLTNNTTTVNINEEKLLNLITDQRIVKLEQIFTDMYQVKFRDIPTNAFNAHLYLCVVHLGLKAAEITDVYNVSISSLKSTVTACNVKMSVNKEYQNYLTKIYKKCLKLNIV